LSRLCRLKWPFRHGPAYPEACRRNTRNDCPVTFFYLQCLKLRGLNERLVGVPQKIKIGEIRELIQKNAFSITDHALTEGFKDGITVGDMIGVVMKGKIIEHYPDRHRCLVFGRNVDGFPVHVVVEFRSKQTVEIITTYVPHRDQWIKGRVRKKRKR